MKHFIRSNWEVCPIRGVFFQTFWYPGGGSDAPKTAQPPVQAGLQPSKSSMASDISFLSLPTACNEAAATGADSTQKICCNSFAIYMEETFSPAGL